MNRQGIGRAILFCSAVALSALLPGGGSALAGPFEDGVSAYDRGQFQKAFESWLPLAQQGDVAAQFNLAALYENGTGVGQDRAEAARWYLEAAKGGDLDAQMKIAAWYEEGTGVPKDPDSARLWYQAVLNSSLATPRAAVARDKARARLAAIAGIAQQIITFDSGRYVIVRGAANACVIALQGGITMDAAFKFDDVVDASRKSGCSKPVLMLESPGGSVDGGLIIGREVRAQEMQTATRYDCASACGFVFMGGVERVLVGSRARIGLHEPASVSPHSRHCSVGFDANGVKAIKRYISWAIPETGADIMKVMMETSCDSITWVNGGRSIALGVATRLEAEGADLFGPKGAAR